MASAMNATFTIERKLRPCEVDRKRALFHQWAERREIIPPSMLKGGHGGGEVAETFALVEFESGIVEEVRPYRVRFLDTECEMQKMEGDFILAEERGLIKKPQPSKEAQP